MGWFCDILYYLNLLGYISVGLDVWVISVKRKNVKKTHNFVGWIDLYWVFLWIIKIELIKKCTSSTHFSRFQWISSVLCRPVRTQSLIQRRMNPHWRPPGPIYRYSQTHIVKFWKQVVLANVLIKPIVYVILDCNTFSLALTLMTSFSQSARGKA